VVAWTQWPSFKQRFGLWIATFLASLIEILKKRQTNRSMNRRRPLSKNHRPNQGSAGRTSWVAVGTP
jgi:hypothetical protein